MADFTTLEAQLNTGSNGSPTWTAVPNAAASIRFFNTNAAGLTTPSGSWPNIVRPGAPTGVDYMYAYTADAVGLGVLGSAGAPTAFTNASYLQMRLHWDNIGTFASAPVVTMYPSSAHGAVTRADGSILGGSADTLGSGLDRSYFKMNAWGRVDSAGAPTVAPSNAPAIADGTTGSVSPTAGANWLTNYQDLAATLDFITAPFTPAAVTDDKWSLMFRLFIGPNLTPSIWQPVWTVAYTHS